MAVLPGAREGFTGPGLKSLRSQALELEKLELALQLS